MITKRLLLICVSVVAVIATVPMFAAFEAHVINVTAKIENALRVNPTEITFGTVFPQEKLEKSLTIALSDSFREQSRVALVYYVIRQKPKCVDAQGNHPQVTEDAQGNFVCPNGSTMMPLLCPYLSKTSPKSGDLSVKPFHGSITNWMLTDTLNWEARGVLDTSDPERDASTIWNIDLKVPCFAGMCAQDWEKFVTDNGPAEVVPSNYIQPVENEHKIFGCDLWIETINITTEPSPSFCGDGAIQQPNRTGTGGPNNDGYEECDTYDIAYQGWGYHCASDCTISRCSLGQGRPCHIQDGDKILRGLQWCTDERLWGECEIEPIQDTNPPTLNNATIPSPTVTAGQDVVILVDASDDISGITKVDVVVEGPGGPGAQLGGTTFPINTPLNWQGNVTINIPAHAANGEWAIKYVHLVDQTHNELNYSNFPATFNVVSQ